MYLSGLDHFIKISIHALREEGDCQLSKVPLAFDRFLSTPSARRATSLLPELFLVVLISIHALREEGDDSSSSERADSLSFLSTPSARRATLLY